MIEQDKINNIKEAIVEFFEKMTVEVADIKVSTSSMEKNYKDDQDVTKDEVVDVLDVDLEITEPQVVIGQQGQTLFEIQRILRAVLSKKFKSVFYLNLDVNGYKRKKIEYLKGIYTSLLLGYFTKINLPDDGENSRYELK